MKHVFLTLSLALLPALAWAQNEMPAIADEEMPAVSTDIPEPMAPQPAPRGEVVVPRISTTVVGEQEAPIGLYIMPWRQSAAQTGLDRPARLLDEALLPLDPEVFRRQVEYHRALSEHLEKTGRATP